jgi:hypothetical protein
LLGWQTVDLSQNDQLAYGQVVFFSLQAIQPAGRNLIGLVALLLGETEAPFFNLAQRKLPLLTDRTQSPTDPFRQEMSPMSTYGYDEYL